MTDGLYSIVFIPDFIHRSPFFYYAVRKKLKSASETVRNWRGHVQIGHKTVIRRLNAHGLRCRRPVQKQVLRPFHIANRLAWAVRHRRWTLRQWSRIIWSDEKCFVIDKKRRQNSMLSKKKRTISPS